MYYRKKPITIEAMQLKPGNILDVMNWVHEECPPEMNARILPEPGGARIRTLEGYMHASWSDWIIKGVKGEFYPCKPDIFKATYEPVRPSEIGSERANA